MAALVAAIHDLFCGAVDVDARNKSGHDGARFGSTISKTALKCCDVGLARANAHGVVDAEDEDLAVPDVPCLGSRRDGLDGLVDQLARHRHLDLDLGQESHCIFGAAIELRVTLLAPIPLHLGRRHSLHADRVESIADLLELEWLDDGYDDFHERNPPLMSSYVLAPRMRALGSGRFLALPRRSSLGGHAACLAIKPRASSLCRE